MKTISKLSTAAGLLFTVAVGIAKEPELTISAKGEDKSMVFQTASKATQTAIKMTDDQNHIIFVDRVQTGNYAKKFNLSALEDGNYYFLAENAIKSYTYKISIEEGEVRLLDKKEKSKPIFRQKGDKLFLNLLNLEAQKVNIKVLDSSSRVVFKETLEDTAIIEKAFNFESAFEDTYTVIVSTEDNSYYEYVTVFN